MISGTMACNGQMLYYEVYGEGTPLLLLPGIGFDMALWGLHQIPAFSAEYQVIAFDNRDAGRSAQATKAYTISDMTEDVVGLLDGLEIDRAHVLGISMGGMIAQELALSHPERVDRLVLIGTGAGTGRSKFDPIGLWSFVKRHDPEGYAFAAQQLVWLFSTDFLRNHQAVDEVLSLFGANPYPMSPEAYERQANAYVQHDALDRVGGIRAPTLVLTGERDRLAPPWIGRELAEAIPGAEFHVLEGPGSSHAALLERPDDFNSVVLWFLKQHTR